MTERQIDLSVPQFGSTVAGMNLHAMFKEGKFEGRIFSKCSRFYNQYLTHLYRLEAVKDAGSRQLFANLLVDSFEEKLMGNETLPMTVRTYLVNIMTAKKNDFLWWCNMKYGH